MTAANLRLAAPQPIAQSGGARRLGLAVVGRLAKQHQIGVRLEHNPAGDTSAVVVPGPHVFAPSPAATLEAGKTVDPHE